MLNLDRLIVEFDKGLRTLFSQAHSARPHPDANLPDAPLDEAERKHAAGLMRINHSGEICAQALYQGQALTARDPAVQAELKQAAQEETEHLAWTSRRVHELGGHLSLLNPLWYTGSPGFSVRDRAPGRRPPAKPSGETARTRRKEPRDRAANVRRRDQAFRHGQTHGRRRTAGTG